MKTVETYAILKSAGWQPGRHKNISESINQLQQRGYHVLDSFVDFYQQFSQLHFNLIVAGNPREIEFDINIPVRYDYDDVIQQDFTRVIDCQNLNPIGHTDQNSYLVIDEQGIIYSLHDYVILIGNNSDEALNNLFSMGWRSFKEYPIPDWWG